MRGSGRVRGVVLTIAYLMALVMLSALLPSLAFAIVSKASLDDLTLRSDAIVVGTVTKASSFWQDGRIYTNVTISVEQTVKGGSLHPEITLRQAGGEVDGVGEWVEDEPGFAVGERAVLFLGRAGPDSFELTGAFQGKLPVENDHVFLQDKYVPLSALLERVTTILEGRQQAPAETEPEGGAGPAAACSITSINPASASAGTGKTVDISGSNFGDSGGRAKFFFYRQWDGSQWVYNWVEGGVRDWKATLLDDVTVPGTASPFEGASSGPVRVEPNAGDACQSSFDFYVTFAYSGWKWAGTPSVSVRMADAANGREAVMAAATTWNGRARFSFVPGGSPTIDQAKKDGENVATWRDLGWDTVHDTGTLASTCCWYVSNPRPPPILECDVEFNSNSNVHWSTDGSPDPTEYDVQSVAVHEFGHFLDLLDLYGGPDQPKVMYGYGQRGSITKRNLQADDVAGIFWIYPLGVGGILEPVDLAQLPPDAAGSGGGYTPCIAAAAAGAMFVIVVSGWYARRRWFR